MGSQAGSRAVAIAYTLIETAKMNGVDLQGWLTHVIDTVADHPANELEGLMPWNFKPIS